MSAILLSAAAAAAAAHGRLPEWPKGTVCKTVGSAYVGSNPTPATRCGNGPLAANSRASGAFLLCPVACHLVALRVGVSRCPRTATDGPRLAVRFLARTGEVGGLRSCPTPRPAAAMVPRSPL